LVTVEGGIEAVARWGNGGLDLFGKTMARIMLRSWITIEEGCRDDIQGRLEPDQF
jgi:hypothetical protein